MLINRRETETGVVVVELFGRFDNADKPALREATRVETNQKLVIDLSLLNHITLEGVQALASLAVKTGIINPNLAFVDPKVAQVNGKLATSGMDLVLKFFATVQEAENHLLADR